MTADPGDPRVRPAPARHPPNPTGRTNPLWDAASLPSGTAVRAAARTAVVAVVAAALVALVGGWRWTLGVLVGGAVVTFVLWVSARLLVAGVRRVAPAVGLVLAMGIYVVAIAGLFVLAATTRDDAGRVGVVPTAAAVGALVVVVVWTATLIVVHVRHDRSPRRRSPRSTRTPPA